MPVNVGSSELVTINQMVSIIEQIAGITVKRNYNLDAPKGVRGRNSDNTLIQEIYGWEPSISLADGLERTYRWIYDQLVGQRADWRSRRTAGRRLNDWTSDSVDRNHQDAIRRSYNRASPQPDEAAGKSRIVKPRYKMAQELTVD